jgi:acyl-CoA dehydrogenase
MAKYWTTEMACRVANWCLKLNDGYGYCEEYHIASAWRDIRASRIMGGTTEIMNGIITEALWL